MITTKTQLQQDINAIENTATSVALAVNAAIHALNISHSTLWTLPADRLTAILQHLYNENLLLEVFEKHHNAANKLNEIAVSADSGARAIDTPGQNIKIENGVVTIVEPEYPDSAISPEV